MANEPTVRYYEPKPDFKLDITDIQNFVYDMSKCIKCKGCTWVDHTYMPGPEFMTRCPSAAKFEFDAYGAYGKMRIGHAMAEGLLDWNEKALEVMEVLRQLNQTTGQTFVLVTHAPEVGQITDRIIRMRDGVIESDQSNGPRKS